MVYPLGGGGGEGIEQNPTSSDFGQRMCVPSTPSSMFLVSYLFAPSPTPTPPPQKKKKKKKEKENRKKSFKFAVYLSVKKRIPVQLKITRFSLLSTQPGFIKSYFDSLYKEEIISEESFYSWKTSQMRNLAKE